MTGKKLENDWSLLENVCQNVVGSHDLKISTKLLNHASYNIYENESKHLHFAILRRFFAPLARILSLKVAYS